MHIRHELLVVVVVGGEGAPVRKSISKWGARCCVDGAKVMIESWAEVRRDIDLCTGGVRDAGARGDAGAHGDLDVVARLH